MLFDVCRWNSNNELDVRFLAYLARTGSGFAPIRKKRLNGNSFQKAKPSLNVFTA